MARGRRASSAYKRPIPSVGAYSTSAHYGGARLRSRRQVSAAWLWGCGFLSSLACMGGCLLGVVIGMIGFRALPSDVQAAAVVTRQMVGQAYLLASNDIFWVSAWLCVIMTALVWLTRRASPPSGPIAAD
ncbi:MAG: hypothetical protein ACK4P1_12070 [Aggregatilineales bacterium]